MAKRSTMSRRLGLYVALVMVTVVGTRTSMGHPVSISGECPIGCPAGHQSTAESRSVYNPKKLYKFNLQSSVRVIHSQTASTNVEQPAVKHTELAITGNVELQVHPDGCTHTLRLSAIAIHGPNNSPVPNVADFQRPVRFVLANGHLEPVICVAKDDTPFELNVKRAVISLLQSTDIDKETDVFGTCPQSVVTTSVTGQHITHKSRQLNECIGRQTLHTAIRGAEHIAHIDSAGPLSAVTLLTSTYDLEQQFQLSDGRSPLKRAQLNETYAFVPLPIRPDDAIRVTVTTQLTADSVIDSPATINAAEAILPTSIVFDNPAGQSTDEKLESILEKTVREFFPKTQKIDSIRPAAATQFADLVRLIRQKPSADLLQFYNKLQMNEKEYRSVFLDALFRAGNSDAIDAISKLLKDKNFDERQRKQAYNAFQFVRSVDSKALDAIHTVLDIVPAGVSDGPAALLGVGHILHRYCHMHSAECNEPAVRVIQEKLVARLNGASCPRKQYRTSFGESYVIAALKALGNSHNIINSKAVVACTGAHQSTRVRVAALQALSASKCNTDVLESASKLFADDLETDAEIRIEAYLLLMRCPAESLAFVSKTLTTLRSDQVGAFVQSHLDALRASSDPHRARARELFQQVRLNRRYPQDWHRYSQEHEHSYGLPAIGAGLSVASRVIYSPRGFLPRSGRLNVTAQWSGASFNILEVGVRQENLERVLEKNIGPLSAVQTQSAQQLYNDFLLSVRQDGKTPAAAAGRKNGGAKTGNVRYRGRRSPADDLSTLLAGIHDTTPDNGLADVDLDASVKLFGTEQLFLSLNKHVPLNIRELMQKLIGTLHLDGSNFTETFELRSLFGDVQIAQTTGAGLPLRLHATGSGAARLRVAGAINATALIQRPGDAKIRLQILPSYSLNVNVALSVDAHHIRTGLDLSASAHSSTGGELEVRTKDSTNITTTLRTEVAEQELIDVQYSAQFATKTKGKPTSVQPLHVTTQHGDCYATLQPLIGVKACAYAHYVNGSYGVLTLLPSAYRLRAYLEVEPLYEITGRYEPPSVGFHRLSAQFAIPNKNQLATVALTTGRNQTLARIFAEMDARNFTASAELGIRTEPNDIQMFAQYIHKDQLFRYLVGAKKQKAIQDVTTYIPRFELTAKNSTSDLSYKSILDYSLSGKIHYDHSKSKRKLINLDGLTVHRKANDPGKQSVIIILNGTLVLADSEYSANVKAANSDNELKLITNVRHKDGIHVDVLLTNDWKGLELANGHVVVGWLHSDRRIEHDLELAFGRDVATNTGGLRRLSFHQAYDYSRGAERSLIGTTNLRIPFINVTLDSKTNYKSGQLQCQTSLQLYKDLRLKSTLKGSHKATSVSVVGDFEGDWELQVNDKRLVSVNGKKVTNDQRVHVEHSLTVVDELHVELQSDYDSYREDGNSNMSIAVKWRLAKDPENTLTGTLQRTSNVIDSNAKLRLGSSDAFTYSFHLDRTHLTGTLNAKIPELLVIDGKFKAPNRAGTGSLSVVLPKSKRTIDITSTFNVKAPKFNVRSTLVHVHNAQKHSVTIDTRNTYEKKALNSATYIWLPEAADTDDSKAYRITLKAEKSGIHFEGQQKANVELWSPETQRTIKLQAHRQAAPNEPNNLSLRASISTPQSPERFISLNQTISAVDVTRGYFHYVNHVDYSNNGTLAFVLDVQHAGPANKAEHYDRAALSCSAEGSLLRGSRLSVELSADEFCPQHAVVRGRVDIGEKWSAQLKSKAYVGRRQSVSGETLTDGRPWSYETDIRVTGPDHQEIAKLTTTGTIQLPDGGNGERLSFNQRHAYESNNRKYGVELHGGASSGKGEAEWSIWSPNLNASSLGGQVSYDLVEPGRFSSNAKAQIWPGKSLNLALAGIRNGVHDGQASVLVQWIVDGQPPTEFQHKLQLSQTDSRQIHAEWTWRANENQWRLIAHDANALNGGNRSIEVKLERPGPVQPVSLLASYDRARGQAILLLGNAPGIQRFEASVTGLKADAEEIRAKFDLDAKALSEEHWLIDVRTERPTGANGPHTLNVETKRGTHKFLEGSLEYNVQPSNVTGKGVITVNGKKSDAEFTLEHDLTDGVSIVLGASLGSTSKDEHKLNANLVVKPQVFHVGVSLCLNRNNCSNVELRSRLTVSGPDDKPSSIDYAQLLNTNFKHELFATVNLSSFRITKDWQLSANTSLTRDRTFHHALESRSRYHLHSDVEYGYFVQVSNGHLLYEVRLPNRTVSLEAKVDRPKSFYGAYQLHLDAYPNRKKSPEKRARLMLLANVQRIENTKDNWLSHGPQSADVRLVLEHPSIDRTASVYGEIARTGNHGITSKLTLDTFQNDDQKIEFSASAEAKLSEKHKDFTAQANVRSVGLNVAAGADASIKLSVDDSQVLASAKAYAGKHRQELRVLIAPSRTELDVHSSLLLVTLHSSLDNSSLVVSTNPVLSVDPLSIEFKRTGLSLVVEALATGALKTHAEWTWFRQAAVRIEDGNGKVLLNSRLALDADHLLEASHTSSSRTEWRDFFNNLNANADKRWNESKATLQKQIDQLYHESMVLVDNVKSALLKLNPLPDDWKQEYDATVSDLLNDPTLKVFVDNCKEHFGSLHKVYQEVYKGVIKLSEEVFSATKDALTEIYKKLTDGLQPAIKQLFGVLHDEGRKFVYNTQSILITGYEKVSNELSRFEPDLKQIGQRFSATVRRLADTVNRWTKTYSEYIQNVRVQWKSALTDLTVWDYIQTHWNKWISTLKESGHQALNEILSWAKDILPTANQKDLVAELDKFLNNEHETGDLNKISSQLYQVVYELVHNTWHAIFPSGIPKTATIHSPWQWFMRQLHGVHSPDFDLAGASQLRHWWWHTLQNIPNHLNNAHRAVWHLLQNASPVEAPFSLRDRLARGGWLPWPLFEKHAQLVNGRTVFTFSGDAFTLEPSTTAGVLLLAHDALNANFTVYARQSDSGSLAAIGLRSGPKTVELLPNGHARAGDQTDLPLQHGALGAYRTVHRIGAWSKAGVHIECTLDLRACSVYVSGFYHGQLRGAFGAASSERYWDGRRPDGSLPGADSTATLAADYAVPALRPVAAQPGSPVCAELWSGNPFVSRLSLCHAAVAPEPYRRACDAYANDADAVCALERAYVQRCGKLNIPAAVRNECIRCAESRAVGELFRATAPGNGKKRPQQADIVLVVDLAESSARDLVDPVVSKVRADLTARHVTDVHVTVFGYHAGRQHVRLFAPAGNVNAGEKAKLNGDVRSDETATKPLRTGKPSLDKAIEYAFNLTQTIREDFLMSADARAFREALKWPFRPEAIKTIVGIRGDSLRQSRNPVKQLGAAVIAGITRLQGIQLHLIAPLAHDDRTPASLVGFDRSDVYALKERLQRDQIPADTNDLGVDMVINAGGLVFDTRSYANDKKKWISVVGATLADRIARTEVQLQCVCAVENGIDGVERCLATNTEQKKPHT